MIFRGTIDLLEPDEENETVLADRKPIPRAEFFAAKQNGIRPAWMFEVRTSEYLRTGERLKIKHENKTYSIYRTHPRPNGITELWCEVKLGGN